MSTPELLNTVQEVYDVLKTGKASLGDILSLVQKFSIDKIANVSEIFEKAVQKVETEVVSLLPDNQKAAFSENLLMVRKFVSENASVKTTILSYLKKLLSGLLPGLCSGGPLPLLPTQVVIRDVVEKVADLPAVKAVEQVVGVSAVKAVEQVVDVSVVQKAVDQVVQQALGQTTEAVSTLQVLPVVLEHECLRSPSSKEPEENPVPVPQAVQDNNMD